MKLEKFLRTAVAPRSDNEDTRRREFILNILLLASIVLLAIAVASSTLMSFVTSVESRTNDAMPVLILAIILLAFIGLYALSRKGYPHVPSGILVSIFFFLSLYFCLRWGSDVPVGLLFYALTIVMAGVLIDSRSALIVAFFLGAYIPFVNYLQEHGQLSMNSYWRTVPLLTEDAVIISAILLIIATTSWLSNREIEKSLRRARASEKALILERDLLEVRVAERTEELRQTQMEKMSQAYRFVEFGRLAGGIFHDLTNPLTALSLNIENIAHMHGTNDPQKLAALTEDVGRARSATAHMHGLMESMRKHLASEGSQEYFSLPGHIAEVLYLLKPYAKTNGVELSFLPSREAELHGDPVAFAQIVTNLISNAIESFSGAAGDGERAVSVAIADAEDGILIRIQDTGAGIAPDVLESIFDPFFSTKGRRGGLGIGLSLAKRIIERDFGGTLSVESGLGTGTAFTVYFPIREP